jgi:predicted N-acetyltransferase YhbS
MLRRCADDEMNIERATKRDFKELMELMALSYRTVNPTHSRFEELLPDLYQPTEDSMSRHFIVRLDRKIVASVGVYPFEVRTANVQVQVAGVGAVCTAPEHRGKGLMSELLQAAREEIATREYPLSWLTGDRERYAPFGWEKVGSDLLVHGAELKPEDTPRGWTLKQLRSLDESLPAIKEARDRMVACGICDDAVFKVKCQRLGMEVWEARQGSAYAYAIANRHQNWLAEWGGDVEGVRALIYKLMMGIGRWVVRLPPLHDDFVNMFLRIAAVIVPGVDNVAVTNLPALTAAYEPYLAPLWPRGKGLHLMMCTDESLITEVCIAGGGKVRDRFDKNDFLLRLNPLQMSMLLFGPVKPSMLLQLPAERQWLDRVFPLPFYVPSLWRV